MYSDGEVLRYFMWHPRKGVYNWLSSTRLVMVDPLSQYIRFNISYKDLQTDYFSDIKAPTQLERDFFRLQTGFDWPF